MDQKIETANEHEHLKKEEEKKAKRRANYEKKKKERLNTTIKKAQILVALETSLGVVTTACRSANVSRTQYYEWLKKDEKFQLKVEDLENVSLDFAESQLHKQIQDGSAAATIFYLKTKGKKRGYIERYENVAIIPEIQPLFPDINYEDAGAKTDENGKIVKDSKNTERS